MGLLGEMLSGGVGDFWGFPPFPLTTIFTPAPLAGVAARQNAIEELGGEER